MQDQPRNSARRRGRTPDQRVIRGKWGSQDIKCGQHSLEVFCAGIFLSFVAHFSLQLFAESHVRGNILMQFLVSFGGIALLCGIAYLKDWTASLDKKPPKLAEDGVTPLRKMGPSILTRPPRAERAAS